MSFALSVVCFLLVWSRLECSSQGLIKPVARKASAPQNYFMESEVEEEVATNAPERAGFNRHQAFEYFDQYSELSDDDAEEAVLQDLNQFLSQFYEQKSNGEPANDISSPQFESKNYEQKSNGEPANIIYFPPTVSQWEPATDFQHVDPFNIDKSLGSPKQKLSSNSSSFLLLKAQEFDIDQLRTRQINH